MKRPKRIESNTQVLFWVVVKEPGNWRVAWTGQEGGMPSRGYTKRKNAEALAETISPRYPAGDVFVLESSRADLENKLWDMMLQEAKG